MPGLSKLRIGGSVGKAAEKLKHAEVLGVPLYAGWQAATGNPVGAFESIRDGGSFQDGVKKFGNELLDGAKNVPLALAGAKLTGGGGGGGLPDIPGLPGGGKDGLDWGKALDLGLGAAGMYQAAKLGQQSTDQATYALDTAKDNWKSREPLRLAGVQGMLNPQPSSNVSQIGAKARAANPFSSNAAPPLPIQQQQSSSPPMQPNPPIPGGGHLGQILRGAR